jgi:hypothetical protein
MLEKLLNRGRIDTEEADKIMESIEERMKILLDSPPGLDLPKPVELLREIPWLADLEENIFNKIVKEFRNRIYAVDAILIKENGPGNSLFVIVRGQVKISIKNKVIDILGPGNVIGEMAVLTGMPRTATVAAESPVTVLWMTTSRIKAIMRESKELEERLLKFACSRFAMNLLSSKKPYNEWQQKEFRQWLAAGEIKYPGEERKIELKGKVGILITGKAVSVSTGKTLTAPAILESSDFKFSPGARVFTRDV